MSLSQFQVQQQGSIIIQLKEILKLDNIELELSDVYYSDVARIASKEKLGARALKGIVERSLFYLMYNAPDFHKQGIKKIRFDKYPDKDYFPKAIYDNKEEELKGYKLYRGVDEKTMEQ